ncbi:unnamed protein product [[Candida] boidinii]|uniref:Unnamed protein product n=1 Tax=Candida boidinii TaxID=5477 RepID=A0ACB5TZK6_CANBO|nr:unnamed protein product [[Candida] boidinii]
MIQLFNAFNGHFVALSNQKYSSHCLETFFIRAASNVEKELLRENGEAEAEEEEEEEEDAEGSSDAYISFENMFLFILTELKPNMKQMIPNQYASHVLRVLLLILAGKELPSSIESNSILRSKKSKIARKMIEIKDSEDYQRNFQTPSSFKDELTDTLQIIYKDQTSKSLREMAIEKVASPVIQLLVQLEGLVDKKRSFWCLIFNDYEVESDKKEEAFVEYLLSDPVGSHFLEVAIDSQRHKNVERLYNYYMKDRVLKLAKRETTGAFVIMTLLKKMKPNHQIELLDQLVPHLNELIVNNLEIGKSVVDCSIERNNYKKDEIISKFIQFFNKDLSSSSNTEGNGKEEEEKDSSNDKVQSQLLENVLRLSTSTLGNTRDDWPTAEERRRALFLEKLISYDDKILMAVIEGLLDLPVERLIQIKY